ncbi:hypothetical protein FIV07_27330 [Mycobacterium sp. THAF192]|nr:hypothetical protein FIV07_27330 [Mycobacterium sp. THAF192]
MFEKCLTAVGFACTATTGMVSRCDPRGFVPGGAASDAATCALSPGATYRSTVTPPRTVMANAVVRDPEEAASAQRCSRLADAHLYALVAGSQRRPAPQTVLSDTEMYYSVQHLSASGRRRRPSKRHRPQTAVGRPSGESSTPRVIFSAHRASSPPRSTRSALPLASDAVSSTTSSSTSPTSSPRWSPFKSNGSSPGSLRRSSRCRQHLTSTPGATRSSPFTPLLRRLYVVRSGR